MTPSISYPTVVSTSKLIHSTPGFSTHSLSLFRHILSYDNEHSTIDSSTTKEDKISKMNMGERRKEENNTYRTIKSDLMPSVIDSWRENAFKHNNAYCS